MAFPTSPTNGQITVVNNVSYQYSNVSNSWTRILSTANIITANTLVSNGYISAAGNVSGNYIFGNGSQLTGITLNPGNISNGTSNVTVVSSGGNITVGVGGTGNIAVFATTGEYVTGIISASGNIISAGNVTGSNLLTGGAISATGTLSVTGATTLGTASTGNLSAGNISTGGIVSATANITGGNVLTAGIVSAASTITGTSHLGSVVSVTANVTGGNLLTGGLISATGTITSAANITGGNILTVGIMSSTGNAIHGNILTSGLISATANITGGNVSTGGLVSSTGNIITAGNISAVGTIYSNGAVNGTAFAVGNSAVSNVGLGFFPTAGTSGEYAIRDYSNVATNLYLDVGMGGTANGAFQFRTSNAFRQLALINSSGISTPLAVSATGNVTGAFFIGNGSQLTGVTATTTSIVNGTSNVVVAASGNVTVGVSGTSAVATFTTVGIIANSVATTNNGNATNFKVGDDAWLGDINVADTIGIRGQQNAANAYIVFGNADNTQLGRSGSGPLTYAGAFSATGNVTGGNLRTAGLISATGTVTGSSLLGTVVSVTANVTGGNLLTGGLISATSTVTGSTLIGSVVTATGNITGGNIQTVGQISATGNITGNFYIGNGAFLTGLNAGATSSLANGATTISIPVASGNIAMSVGGESNTVVVNLGSLTMYGTFAGPKTLAANVAVADSVNALLLGPVTIGNGYHIDVPSNSTLSTYGDASPDIVGATLTVSGNITGGNVLSNGLISATGNILTTGLISATANITGGNVLTSGLISATGNITGNNIFTGGDILPTANATANIGGLSFQYNTIFAKATSAQYADLAENYEADANYEPGTVLCFGGAKEVTVCNLADCISVAGVVSTNPSYLMNSGQTGEYVAAVALQGRVPTKVTGQIRKGDLIVSAGDGRGRANNDARAGTIIGKALVNSEGDAVIEVVVGRN